jgi:hypothetical protein
VNLKLVKNLLRNNSIDCNPYLEAVCYAPKGSFAKNTLRWRLTETGLPIFFDFSELATRSSTEEYKGLRQLQACVSTTSSAHWKELAQASLLPSSITPGNVSGKGSKGSKGSKGGGGGKGGGKGSKGESAKTNLVSAPLDHLPSVSELPQSSGYRGMGLPYPTLNALPPTGCIPYSNSYGIPGFDAVHSFNFSNSKRMLRQVPLLSWNRNPNIYWLPQLHRFQPKGFQMILCMCNADLSNLATMNM